MGRPETDLFRSGAMTILGSGLHEAGQHEDALSVQEAEFAMERRRGAAEDYMLGLQNNIAKSYDQLGRREEALRMHREIYAARLRLTGPRDGLTLFAAGNLARQLLTSNLWAEAKQFLREQIPIALEALGPDHVETLKMRGRYATVLVRGSEKDYAGAVTILDDVVRRCRRVCGDSHPLTERAQGALAAARRLLSMS